MTIEIRESVREPKSGWPTLPLGELWRHRELLYFLAWRDMKVRYKQTVFGAGWAVAQPLITMLVFTVIFGHFAHLPSSGVPYSLLALTGLLPWFLFSSSIVKIGQSLIANQQLISKVYVPRLLIPLAAVTGGIVDLLIGFVLLLGIMAYYCVAPGVELVAAPAFILLALAVSLGAGLWLGALNVRYRDVGYVIPFLIQVLLYVSPVAYSGTALIPDRWRWLYDLNPLTTVINGFRWSVLDVPWSPSVSSLVSVLLTLVALVGGAFYFRRAERTFADVI